MNRPATTFEEQEEMSTDEEFDSPVLSGLRLPALTSDQGTAYEVAVESMRLLTARYTAHLSAHQSAPDPDPVLEQSLPRQIDVWVQKERDLQPGDDTAVQAAQQDASRTLDELRGHGH
jgi:hypothetical protein